MVESVDMGSVVLRLVAMTDYASERLLAENGENMKKLVETFLKFSDLKEDMIKGNIKVTVLVPEEEIGSDDQTMASDKEIKVKENWNMLVEELEPSILAKKLLEKGVLNDSDITAINKKVRYGLLSRLKEVIDEIESEFIEETFKQCGFLENPMDKVKSDMSKSRKERALNFLMSIFVNDAYVLAFKNVLDSYKLNPLYELKMPIDETPRTTRKRSKGEKLFECEYKVIRKGEEDSHMTQEAAYSKMDWESYGLLESKRQPDESKPKRFEPKKRHIKLEPKPRSMHQAQAAVQPKRIFGRSGDDGSKEEWWSVVVALDFGTTYSGYAFWRKDNDPLDITPGKWKTESKEVLESLKTPTSLLLNKENKIIEFGFEAEKIFKELVEDGNDEEYRFFRQFKMLLHDKNSFNMDMLIEDHLHNPIKALDVFSLSIQYLKDECIELFQKKHINVANDEILWILTVPAIWDESAKQFMRKAAEQAEIPSDQLKLALEPEAAAIYVVKGAKTVFGKESVTTVRPGTKIMLADLGGGTADLTVLELNEDKTMKQLHRSFGGAWGGNLINKKIWEIMTDVFGKEVIDEFKKLTADYIDMESNIELRKRDISTGSKLQLQILPSLADLCKTKKGKGYKQLVTESGYTNVKVRTGKLSFEPDLVEEIFDLTFTNLYTNVEKVLHNQNMKGIKDIILVGGFAQADFIVKQFKERFSRYNVIIPTDPVLAVLKGAVMFGQDIDIISSRITAHTYGFDSMRYFTEGIDPRSKKRKIDNTFYCVDVFEKTVAIGDSVDVGKTVKKEVFASSKDMKLMVLNFYQSDKKDPEFVTDDSCKCIGKLSVEMPDLSGGTERSVMVSIKFGETEIEVCGEDKTTGKKQETKLNLLGDTK
uniref:Heat shock 70 kDa protein 12A n=1 Tax=Magallana gigas TaxID=29159 RepID=K1PRX6_MAGGI